MGNLSALALQDEELNFTLEQQISLHFQTNCYPPIPQQMVDTAVEALDCINNGEGHLSIKLPAGVTFRGSEWANCWDIAESYRLGMWIIESELYDE